ncbi:MAG TPA: protein kinase [Candidatus Acidoferrales bacterium]|nr:protein kinase [Candidatus Acidoferrales bacterium]
MSLASGTNLGPYEIQAPLGAGGMGEVYRARDTRLDRTVAVKILPQQLSNDPVRKQRFEREAKTISGLNHPHICVLYDVGRQDGIEYLVMECIEGETLAKRLEKGPLPLDQALQLGAQIAGALDKAHRQGIVHRDLKPGNIMITPAGAKLLDFGLAKPTGPALSNPLDGATMTAAPSSPVTEQGVIMGTFHYMSPEQVEGKEVDGRSDLFSLGAVLYETVTGKRAFEGKSPLSVASAILEKEPQPISAIKPVIPAALNRCIARCLAKDPDRRWQNAGDLAIELRWIAEDAPVDPSTERVQPGARYHPMGWILAALFLVLATAAGAAWLWFPRATTIPRVTRFAVTLPPGEILGGSWYWYRSIALSPEGSRIAYVATQNGASQMYLRSLDDFTARPIAGTEGADTPFFSPDGQWLGFIADQKLQKVPVAGGSPVVIASVSGVGRTYGAIWTKDDEIYFGAEPPRGLLKVSAMGGTPQPLTKLDSARQETDHRYPELLPGGRVLLFTVRNASEPSFDEADIAAVNLATGQRHMLVSGGTDAHYVSGHLIFLRRGVLLAAPFDPTKLEVTGAATPVVENVVENPRIGGGQFSVSRDGSLVYIPGGVSFGEHELVLVDKNGNVRPLTATKRAYEDFSISPDGRFIATTIEGPVTDTWIHDIARDSETRFTYGVEHRDPAWTPDGKRVTYSGYKDGQYALLTKAVDGSSGEEVVVSSAYPVFPWFWSPDGKTLLYNIFDPDQGDQVLLKPVTGDSRRLVQSPFQVEFASWSPDGRSIAYNTDESGRQEVYVVSFPGAGNKTRISSDGGMHPLWAPSGRELYYRAAPSMESLSARAFTEHVRVMAVPVETSPTFKAGTPRMLFQGPYFSSGHDYAVMPDGRGFIMIRESESQSGPTEMRVILNWSQDLGNPAPPQR